MSPSEFLSFVCEQQGIKPYKSFRAVLEHSRAHYPEADVLLLTGDFSQVSMLAKCFPDDDDRRKASHEQIMSHQ